MLPKHRPPTHPGEMLLKEFIEPKGLTQKQVAEHLGWSYTKLNELIHARKNLSADAALALSEAFGMKPEFWLKLQIDWDLWHALRQHKKIPLIKIPKVKAA